MEGERFTTEWLKVRLNRDVMANFCEEIGQEVKHSVVPNDGEFPCGAGKGTWLMVKVEMQTHFVGRLGGGGSSCNTGRDHLRIHVSKFIGKER